MAPLVALLAASWVALAAAQPSAETSSQTSGEPREIRRSVEAAADGVVEVTNVSGSVVVSGWDRSTVEVVGSVGRGVESLTVERRDQRVVVSVSQTLRRAASADLELRVPRSSRLEVEGMQSDVRVEGVEGEVIVRTMTGTIGVEGRGGRVDLQAISGVLDLGGTVSRGRLDNVSGPIRVRGTVASLDAESVNGPLDLEIDGLEDGRIENVTGPIVARLRPLPGGRVEIRSFSGRVELAVDPSVAARIRATSRGGRVMEDVTGEAEIVDDGDGRTLVLELGQASPGEDPAQIELRSFSGDLRLVKH